MFGFGNRTQNNNSANARAELARGEYGFVIENKIIKGQRSSVIRLVARSEAMFTLETLPLGAGSAAQHAINRAIAKGVIPEPDTYNGWDDGAYAARR